MKKLLFLVMLFPLLVYGENKVGDKVKVSCWYWNTDPDVVEKVVNNKTVEFKSSDDNSQIKVLLPKYSLDPKSYYLVLGTSKKITFTNGVTPASVTVCINQTGLGYGAGCGQRCSDDSLGAGGFFLHDMCAYSDEFKTNVSVFCSCEKI